MSNEKIRPPTTSNNIRSPKLKWHNSRIRVEFKGSCVKQVKVTFTPNNVVNLFIVYELDRWSKDLNADLTLKDFLFGAVKFTKNAVPDKYSYSRYSIGFDSRSHFLYRKIYQSNAKNSAIEPYALCLGNISKDFTANDMKKNSIKWICVRFFC